MLDGECVPIGGRSILRFLFDCRFIVQVNLAQVPETAMQRLGAAMHISVTSSKEYNLPLVKITGSNQHALSWNCPSTYLLPGQPLNTGEEWIMAEHARTLTIL